MVSFIDPLNAVTLFVSLVVLLHPDYVVSATLGEIGRPEILMAALLLVWWLGVLVNGVQRLDPGPIRWLVLSYWLVWNTSVAFAMTRGLTGGESAGAERFFIKTIGLCGVALLVAELIPSREALDRLLRRMVMIGAVMGLVGVAQFYVGWDPVARIPIPLPTNGESEFVLGTRGSADLTRAPSTTAHSIEFGVLSALFAPLGVHYALTATTVVQQRRWWLLTALCSAGIVLSVSRSGTVAAGIVIFALLRCWRPERQRQALVRGFFALILLRLSTPGLLGTILSFFQNAGTDNSVTGRTEDYDDIFRLVQERPLFGLGGGTFRPEVYFILDNYFLNALVSTGFVGLIAFLALVFVPYSMAIRVGRTSAYAANRHLGFALGASLLAGFGSSFLFDSLNFPGFSGIFYVLVGAVGVLWRFRDVDPGPTPVDAIIREPKDLVPWMRRVVDRAHNAPVRAE